MSAGIFGIPDLPIVLIEEAVTNQPDAKIRELIDGSMNELVRALTEPPVARRPSETHVAPITVEGPDWLSVLSSMNHRFLREGWGDGLPLLPPTRERVAAMLEGTRLPPDSVVAIMDPGRGVATVEKIAINAAMAGCDPEHMPVLIAAVKCSADPKAYWRQPTMSTSPTVPLIMVNGPIAKKLRINSGASCMGPGADSRANVLIGRAFHLCIMNIGHAWPGSGDLDTQGTPMKLGFCFAENEDASPWDPYHVELGYSADTSIVTVKWVWPPSDSHGEALSRAEDIMQTVADAAKNAGVFSVGVWLQGRDTDPYSGAVLRTTNMVVLSPDTAQLFAREGWSKNDVREYLWKHARLPFGRLQPTVGSIEAFRRAHPDLVWLLDRPETDVPVVEASDCFEVVVAGGANMNARVQYFHGLEEPLHAVVEV